MKKIITYLLFLFLFFAVKQSAAQPDTICGTYDGFHQVIPKFEYDYRGNPNFKLPCISSGIYTQGPPENQTLLYNCFYHVDETTGNFVNFLGVVSGPDPGDGSVYGDQVYFTYGVSNDPTPVYRQVNFWCHQYYECSNVNQHVPTTNPNNPSNNWSSPSTWIDNAVPSASESTILLTKITNLNINLSLSGQLLISSTGSAIVAAGVTITNPNMLVRTNGLLQNNGTLKGIGKINGSLTNNGTIDPGNPIGAFSIRDNYTATASAIHKIEIAGTNSNDTIKVGGQTGTTGGVATLKGILSVSFINGFIPSLGDTYKVFTFNSSTGVFATESLPAIPGGLCWSVHYNANDVTLEVVNNCLPTITIADKAIQEGNSGTKQMSFKVTLSSASTSTVTVNFTTANGSAIAGSDYVATSGTVKIKPGKTSKAIKVLINGDTQVEANEQFNVQLSAPVNATIADYLAVGTIRNDDAATIAANINSSDAAITKTITLKASPNPTKDQVTISGLSADASNYIELIDLSGRILLIQKFTGNTTSISIAKYAAGIYLLRYYDGHTWQQVKLVKE